MIIEIISITVVVYSFHQIGKFYNISLNFPWFYFSYYLFLILMKWLCGDDYRRKIIGYVFKTSGDTAFITNQLNAYGDTDTLTYKQVDFDKQPENFQNMSSPKTPPLHSPTLSVST